MATEWNDKLLSRDRAWVIAGDAGLYVRVGYAQLAQFTPDAGEPQPSRWQVNMACGLCHGSVIMLASMGVRPGATLITQVNYDAVSPDEILAATVRHLVQAHDVSLSGTGPGRDEMPAPARPPNGQPANGHPEGWQQSARQLFSPQPLILPHPEGAPDET